MVGEIEKVINKVVEETGLSKEDVIDRVKKKQVELSGLVSEEGAAYIIANELGVKARNNIAENILKIKDIMEEMKSVTVLGRVKGISGPREFTTKTGKEGKVANVEILDDTGAIRVALWNMSDIEKVEKKEVNVGDIIQVKNGYVRPGYQGGIEINLGNRGMIITEPEDVKEEDFPKVEVIDGIAPGSSVNMTGRITHAFPVREFDKNDRKGKVGNLVINDGSKGMRIVLWNEQADIMDKLEVGDIVKVGNALAKEGLRGMELHANQSTKVEKNPEGVDLPKLEELTSPKDSERVKISDLKEGDTYKEIMGTLTNVFEGTLVHDMCPTCRKKLQEGKCGKCGEVKPEKLLIVNAMVDDGTGSIRIALFRDAAENLIGMKTDEIDNDPEKVGVVLQELVGTQRIFEGRVKMNTVMDAMEFTVFNVRDVDAKEEADKLAQELDLNDK